jgi:hypothetical protein
MSGAVEKRCLSRTVAAFEICLMAGIADIPLISTTLRTRWACLPLVAAFVAFVRRLAAFRPHDDSAVGLLPFRFGVFGFATAAHQESRADKERNEPALREHLVCAAAEYSNHSLEPTIRRLDGQVQSKLHVGTTTSEGGVFQLISRVLLFVEGDAMNLSRKTIGRTS